MAGDICLGAFVPGHVMAGDVCPGGECPDTDIHTRTNL